MLLSQLILSKLKFRHLKRFTRNDRGVTAVEMALLAVPFFALLGAILETAVVFLASQILDGAVQDSGRLIRTGQAQSNSPAPYTSADFQNAICSRLFNLFDCTKLLVNVTVVSNFASATAPPSPIDPTDPSKWTLAATYNPGTGSSVIMVQVYYKWPVILNFDGFNLATSSDGTHLLAAVRVFANEPFTS
jgi:Flp pilus assembly protein TadG